MDPVKSQANKVEECLGEEQLKGLKLQAENDEYNKYMELIKSFSISEIAPPEWLKHAETPFKWSQCLKPELLFKANYGSKLEDYNNSAYIFEKCSLLLTFIFERVILKENVKARTYLNQIKDEVLNISCDESSEMCTRLSPALNHIYSATNAYLMSISNDLQLEETARKIGGSLKPISQMSSQVQAAVEALKGMFYLWCYTDSNYALKHLLAASKLDPEFALWQYWTGKALRKTRKQLKEKEPKEEIPYLESAVEKQRDHKHLVYLAQAYREKAQYLQMARNSDLATCKSDISKEVDVLNQKSLALYSNNTQNLQSETLTVPSVCQMKERIFNCGIDFVVCSEKKDLIITADSRGDVSLHRSLDLHTVWTRKPPEREVKRVQKLTWRPDGQAIAIAYSFSEVERSKKEDSVVKALVLIVSIENEHLHHIIIENSDVTCLSWCESMITSSFPPCLTNYFPNPTPLSSDFCLGVDRKKFKHLLKENSESILNFLVIGSSIGDLKVLAGGFLPCCSLSICDLLGHDDKTYSIRNTVLSSDMKVMFVLIEKKTTNLTERDVQLLILDTSVLSSKTAEINCLKTRMGRVLTLVDHITEVQSCLIEVWECLKVAEVAANFNKYAVHFDSVESMAADFCELITFGVLSSSLEQFLLLSLNYNSVKKIIQSVKDNCSNVETLVSTHLKPFLEELLIILSEMTGLAELKQFNQLGLTNSFLSVASNDVQILILKAAEFYMVVQKLEKSYSAFYQWLSEVVTKINSDEIHKTDFSDVLTERNLPLITDYLSSICQISCAYNEPISFFQHLSQYFEDKCLSEPFELCKWQELLQERSDLVKVACFIPVSKTLSLSQCFKNFYKSISVIGYAPEKSMSPLFAAKNVICLPEISLESSILKSCYFTDNLTLMTAFVNSNNTGEFGLLEVLPCKENYTKQQKVLRLGNGGEYKCLDVQWYPGGKVFALFEDRENSNLILTQIEQSVISMLNSDSININAIQNGVFLWKIPHMPVSCFSLSCQRMFGVIISKSKKKIKMFDFEFHGDSINKD